ncbi:MAG: DNA polymerase III subunit delta [bacterium]
MKYREFLNKIGHKAFSSEYLLIGNEDFLVEDALNRLLTAFCDPSTRDFNLDVFYGKEVEAGKLLEIVNAYPMMSDSRVVVVKEAQKLSPSALEVVANYLENPSPTTKLILLSNKAGSRNRHFSRIKSKAELVECNPLYDREIPAWIVTYLKPKGCEISDEAAAILHARTGNNLREIVNELEKILLNLDSRNKIEKTDVQNVVGLSRTYSVFDLTDAIGFKDLSRALRILDQMLQSGEQPSGILVMITRHFVNLYKLKGAMAQRTSHKALSELTGIPHFFIAKTKEMADKYAARQYERIFDDLLQTDLMLKTSAQKPRMALESLLIKIMK